MVIFIIPAYNESENILALLNKTHERMMRNNLPYKVIIVNDGSTDNTLEILHSLKDKIPLVICSHYPNRGVGEAFRIGFCRVLLIAKKGDIIVTKEADNTSDLEILDKLIAKINDGYDVVLASCYAKEGAVLGTTLFRMILSKCANKLIKLFVPTKEINTFSSFYRSYSYNALKDIHRLYGDRVIEQNGFECMVELLIKFSRNGKFKITEVPMVLDGSKRVGKSKMRTFRTIKGFLRVIVKDGVIYRIKQLFR